MTLVELARNKIYDYRMKYIIRKYAHIWNVPSKKVVINPNITIEIVKLEHIDK